MTTALERGEGSAARPCRCLPPGKHPVPIVQEGGWARRPVWTGAESLAFTGIRSPDGPARSQSLYRLSYPAHAATEYELYFYLLSTMKGRHFEITDNTDKLFNVSQFDSFH